MGKRRDGRRLIIQFLYQQDLAPETSLSTEQLLKAFRELTNPGKGAWQFAEPVLRSITPKLDELDQKIVHYSDNWQIERMASVDKNILRLALFELFYCDEIPPIASMNEAIDLAKEMSTEDSGKFVNGILDRAKKELTRPLRQARPRSN